MGSSPESAHRPGPSVRNITNALTCEVPLAPPKHYLGARTSIRPERVAHAITRALETVPSATRVVVENTAGAGATVGRTPEEIGAILAHVPKRLRRRTGYGLDTCHLFAAGHDITSSPTALAEVLDAFEAAADEPPAFFHLNDSEWPFASNRDRHALIGKGKIGVNPFRWLLHDQRSTAVPLILETPQVPDPVAEDDPSPDPHDVAMNDPPTLPTELR